MTVHATHSLLSTRGAGIILVVAAALAFLAARSNVVLRLKFGATAEDRRALVMRSGPLWQAMEREVRLFAFWYRLACIVLIGVGVSLIR
jgi:hypothetical protein